MPIILFDGVCNFCNRTINIILKYDKDAYFQFAPSQSNAAMGIMQQFGLEQQAITSVILIDNELKQIKDGILGDIAPTILDLMGIEQPEAMTQQSLIQNEL